MMKRAVETVSATPDSRCRRPEADVTCCEEADHIESRSPDEPRASQQAKENRQKKRHSSMTMEMSEKMKRRLMRRSSRPKLPTIFPDGKRTRQTLTQIPPSAHPTTPAFTLLLPVHNRYCIPLITVSILH